MNSEDNVEDTNGGSKNQNFLIEDVQSPVPDKKGSLFQMYKDGKIDSCIPSSQEQRQKNLITKKKLNVDDSCEIPQASTSALCAGSMNASHLIVNHRQKGNGVVSCLRNVRWGYDEIEPDFVMNRTSCALFLSIKYHKTKPGYIFSRIRAIGASYELRVLLVLVDVEDATHDIRELSQLCISNNLTMLLAWNNDEAARYLESFKMFENKPPDILTGERLKSDVKSGKEEEINKVVGFLTSIASVNKTDARTLIERFGSIEAIMLADLTQLMTCSGLGALKAKNLYELFRKPLKKFENN